MVLIMSNQEKKEVINQVMHLLRCGEISSATPNKDVWKLLNIVEDKKPEPHKRPIPVVEITTSIPANCKDYQFMWFDEYHQRWNLSCTMHAPNDERAIRMADEYYEENGDDNTKYVLFDDNRIVKIY